MATAAVHNRYTPVIASNTTTAARASAAERRDQLPRGSRRTAAAVLRTYTRTSDPVVSSTSGRGLNPAAAATASAIADRLDTSARLRRGTSPVLLPCASQAGSAPSRPSAAPSFAAPA